MRTSKHYSKTKLTALGLALVAPFIFSPTAKAESCADAFHSAASASSQDKLKLDCSDYEQCLATGQQSLKEGNPGVAVEAFSKALSVAGDDSEKRGVAYGCLGLGQEASGNAADARSSLERARTLTDRKLGWVEKEYKRLLSSQKLLTAADIEKKLNADKKIMTAEQVSQPVATEEAIQIASAEDNSGEPTANMTATRGFTADLASLEDPDKYKPKPLSQTSKSHPQAAHLGVAATKPTKKGASHPTAHGEPQTVAAAPANAVSLDLQINFEFRSSELTAEGKAQADELGKALEKLLQDGKQQAVLIGHTDIYGSEDFNDHLSEDRATAVRTYLSKAYPDLTAKLSERGMGKRQPLYWDKDEDSQKLNRRVEVKLIELAQ